METMKPVLDKFSQNSGAYKKFRPEYPARMLQKFVDLVEVKGVCWDCGTGNGQVAVQLHGHFDTVYATDISQNQIDHAAQKDNIQYIHCRSEKTPIPSNSVDLIVVGQALHWFDFDAFYKEVIRVAKEGAILAVFGYGLLRVDVVINHYLDLFYYNRIGKYWDAERDHVDAHYKSIPFPFEELKMKQQFFIVDQWNRSQLEGYLNTWSSVKKCISVEDRNPVNELIQSLEERCTWKKAAIKDIKFPIFSRIGKIKKPS